MLQKETIIANPVLATLNEEQIAALVTLSANDEDAVIGKKIGELHSKYDQTIFEATGVPRDGHEKSYVYLQRAAAQLREKGSSVDAELQTLKTEKARLDKAIQDGGSDKELRGQLQSVVAELAQTKDQFNLLQTEKAKLEKTFEEKLNATKFEFELAKAKEGIKLRADLPEQVLKVVEEQALNAVKSYTRKLEDNGKGGKDWMFYTKDGARMNNPENHLNPYTAKDLIAKTLKDLGVLDTGIQATGTGATAQVVNGKTVVSLQGAKTQIEADIAIARLVAEAGHPKGSTAHAKEAARIRAENNVAALPLR